MQLRHDPYPEPSSIKHTFRLSDWPIEGLGRSFSCTWGPPVLTQQRQLPSPLFSWTLDQAISRYAFLDRGGCSPLSCGLIRAVFPGVELFPWSDTKTILRSLLSSKQSTSRIQNAHLQVCVPELGCEQGTPIVRVQWPGYSVPLLSTYFNMVRCPVFVVPTVWLEAKRSGSSRAKAAMSAIRRVRDLLQCDAQVKPTRTLSCEKGTSFTSIPPACIFPVILRVLEFSDLDTPRWMGHNLSRPKKLC